MLLKGKTDCFNLNFYNFNTNDRVDYSFSFPSIHFGKPIHFSYLAWVKKQQIPLLLLLMAALFLFFIKTNQRGRNAKMQDRVTIESATDAYTQLRGGNKTIIYSKHAKCRMDCRQIDESEVKEILQKGEINFTKEKESDEGVTYPMEGTTHDGQRVRIVFAPHENDVTVVTCIDLDKDWPCGECK
jgi:hypothetical protein